MEVPRQKVSEIFSWSWICWHNGFIDTIWWSLSGVLHDDFQPSPSSGKFVETQELHGMGPTTRENETECGGKLSWSISYVVSCTPSFKFGLHHATITQCWSRCLCSVALWGPQRAPQAEKVDLQGMVSSIDTYKMLQCLLDHLNCLSCNDSGFSVPGAVVSLGLAGLHGPQKRRPYNQMRWQASLIYSLRREWRFKFKVGLHHAIIHLCFEVFLLGCSLGSTIGPTWRKGRVPRQGELYW